jgi:hypothetical protein
VKMTARAWCAISKAVEMIKTAQNTSVGRAEAWLIEACVAGNIRSRVPSSADSELLLNDNGPVSMDPRPGSRPGIISRRRAPKSVSPAAWNDAVIDGDVLVDTNQVRWSDLEISIADLEFDIKQALRPAAAARPIPRAGGRQSDKEAIVAEAQRRVAADESIPTTLSAFARELHFWLDEQPKVLRRNNAGKVLGPASIEEHIRPLWRKRRIRPARSARCQILPLERAACPSASIAAEFH